MIVVAALSDQNPQVIDEDCIKEPHKCVNRHISAKIIRKDYPKNFITYFGKKYPIIKYENIDEAISGELKEYKPPEEEIEIKKKYQYLSYSQMKETLLNNNMKN